MDIGCFGAPFEFKFLDASGGAPGSFEGYGAVFGNVDSHGDVIEPGAFANSLLSRKQSGRALPPMYKQHGMAGMGRDPIGVWDHMEEDSAGLVVKGRIIGLDTEQGKFNYAQAKEGALRGLSIGYRVMPNGSRKGSGRVGEPSRFLKMLHLSEVSIVDDPSNARARIGAMKAALVAGEASFADEIKTIRDFEEFLRDAGFSNAAARSIATSGFKAKPDPRDEEGVAAVISKHFAELAQSIRS